MATRGGRNQVSTGLGQFQILRFVDRPLICPVFLHGCSVSNARSIYLRLGFVNQILRPVELVRDSVWGGRIRSPLDAKQHLLFVQGLKVQLVFFKVCKTNLETLKPLLYPHRESARKSIDHPGSTAPNFVFWRGEAKF